MTQEKLNTLQLSSADFDTELAASKGPVLVDFWAEWCGPCRMLGPVIESLADDYDGRATVAKVDIDQNPELAQRYGVRSIPTVLVFDQGEVSESIVGVRQKADYERALNQHLS
ncbi:MAG: thioredoxin [Pseudomonadota bacterium]